MIVCCEQCTHRFEVPSAQLTEKGSIVLCPECQHPHQVFRKVVPFKVLGIDETHHVRQWNPQDTVTVHAEAEESGLSPEKTQAVPQAISPFPLPRKKSGLAKRLLVSLILLLILATLGLLGRSLFRRAPG